jgi:hypothetical protein
MAIGSQKLKSKTLKCTWRELEIGLGSVQHEGCQSCTLPRSEVERGSVPCQSDGTRWWTQFIMHSVRRMQRDWERTRLAIYGLVHEEEGGVYKWMARQVIVVVS